MKLILAIIAVWVAVIALLPYAWAIDDANQADIISQHKESLVDKQVADDAYEQSEQAANSKHANNFIAAVYGRYGNE